MKTFLLTLVAMSLIAAPAFANGKKIIIPNMGTIASHQIQQSTESMKSTQQAAPRQNTSSSGSGTNFLAPSQNFLLPAKSSQPQTVLGHSKSQGNCSQASTACKFD